MRPDASPLSPVRPSRTTLTGVGLATPRPRPYGRCRRRQPMPEEAAPAPRAKPRCAQRPSHKWYARHLSESPRLRVHSGALAQASDHLRGRALFAVEGNDSRTAPAHEANADRLLAAPAGRRTGQRHCSRKPATDVRGGDSARPWHLAVCALLERAAALRCSRRVSRRRGGPGRGDHGNREGGDQG